jgi:alpha-galactosidase
VIDGVRPTAKALEVMVNRVAEIYSPPLPARVATGWCSWYYYYADLREENILENLRYLAKHRNRYPYEYVQIDDGYQLHWGDWLSPGSKFPHDMAWISQQIKELGFKPGIWVAPLIMSAQSNLFRDHPDWALRRHDTGEIYMMEG